MKKSRLLLFAPVVLARSVLSPLHAAEKLTDYCSAQEDWCQLMATGFGDGNIANGHCLTFTLSSSYVILSQAVLPQLALNSTI